MIASRLVLWHTYSRGVAFDLSENRNHGTIVDASYGDPGFPTALHFPGGPGSVWVAPSRSLSNLGALRTQVHFHWDPTFEHRHNLIEGHLAFAFFVNPDGSLQATILNGLGAWAGAESPPGVVTAGQWHTAEFVHDGISNCTLYVDGNVVAESYSSPGPVGTVGPHGVAIGHWPEQSDVYSFEGYMDDVRVWCDDPPKDVGQLIDGCCIDRAAIAKQTATLGAAGLDAASLGDAAHTLLSTGREGAYWLAQGSQAEREHALGLGARLLEAYRAGDHQSLLLTAQEGAALLQSRATPEQLEQMWSQLEPVLSHMPFYGAAVKGDAEELRKWLAPWCLEGWVTQPFKPHRPPPATDNSTDPDTDAPSGQSPPGWTDPTQHEQVPPPPPPPPTSGGHP